MSEVKTINGLGVKDAVARGEVAELRKLLEALPRYEKRRFVFTTGDFEYAVTGEGQEVRTPIRVSKDLIGKVYKRVPDSDILREVGSDEAAIRLIWYGNTGATEYAEYYIISAIEQFEGEVEYLADITEERNGGYINNQRE